MVNNLKCKKLSSELNIQDEFIAAIEKRYLQRRKQYSDILQFLLQSKYNVSKNKYYNEPHYDQIYEAYISLCMSDEEEVQIVECENEDNDTINIDLASIADNSRVKVDEISLRAEVEKFIKTKKLTKSLLELAVILLTKNQQAQMLREFSVCAD